MRRVFLLLLSISIIFSCKKQEEIKPKETKSFNELKVSKDFDWKTTSEIELKLIGYANSTVTIYMSNGAIIQRALLKRDQEYKTVISVPLTESEFKLDYMGQTINLSTKNKSIEYKFN